MQRFRRKKRRGRELEGNAPGERTKSSQCAWWIQGGPITRPKPKNGSCTKEYCRSITPTKGERQTPIGPSLKEPRTGKSWIRFSKYQANKVGKAGLHLETS